MDDHITGRFDTISPSSPYYKDTTSDEDKVILNGLSRCPLCCNYFDPNGEIENGDILENPLTAAGIEPQYYKDEECKECKEFIKHEKQRDRLKIRNVVSDYFFLIDQDILHDKKHQRTLIPRQLAMHLYREREKMKVVEIGLIFKRTHADVLNSLKAVESYLLTNYKYTQDHLNNLNRILNG